MRRFIRRPILLSLLAAWLSACGAGIVTTEMVIFEWRGKPIYVVRRTKETLDGLNGHDDMYKDATSANSKQPPYVDKITRAIPGHDEYLVLIGICTHLGCAPMYRPDVGAQDLGGDKWFGGFFCPCHGSKFDLSGRVFNGVPAPSNLEVPPYSYESDGVIVIGVDQEGA